MYKDPPVFSVLQRPDILEELQKSQKVFAEKLNHLSRRLAWINATIYSKVTQLLPFCFAAICLSTLKQQLMSLA